MAARGGSAAIIGVIFFALGAGLRPAPAAAQGIFESIFGGLRRALEAPSRAPTRIDASLDPFEGNPAAQPRPDSSGPSRAFCVRTCDGQFFPVQAQPGMSAAVSCRSFCPASETRLYSGSTIDYAVASDGSRYADLDNAFVYRKQRVASCTCNGRGTSGLAPVDVNADPALRPGDMVATSTGLVAFTGTKNNVAAFTPVTLPSRGGDNRRNAQR